MSLAVAKSLSRLPRERLLNLCIAWSKSSKCNPYLASNRNILETEEEDYLHEPAESRTELNSVYEAFKSSDSGLQSLTKRDIIDRILDGDWRRGLSYDQLASIDFACLEENDTSLRWTALELVPLTTDTDSTQQERAVKRRKLTHREDTSKRPRYPETTVNIFVQNLKSHISPLVKAHYHIHRLVRLRLSVIRLYVTPNTPFAPLCANIPRQGRLATDTSRVVYIALPDSCPYVYVSISSFGGPRRKDKKAGDGMMKKVDIAATKRVILEAIPKALSRPQQRWSLQPTKLTARSLQAMVLLRGSGKVGACGGSFAHLVQSRYDPSSSQSINEVSETASDISATDDEDEMKLEQEIEQRFGNTEGRSHAKLDRVHVRIQDILCLHQARPKKRKASDDTHRDPAPITITMAGSDVFAGLRQFALKHPQYLDLSKLPSPLTGEEGNTSVII